MTSLRATFVSLSLAALTTLSGCGGQPETATPDATDNRPRVVLVGVDRTEAFEVMTRDGLALAGTVLSTMRPGEALYCRWISDVSYRETETFVQAQFPDVSAANALDARGRQEAAEATRQFRELARTASDSLAAQVPERMPELATGTRSTDLHGFLAAASETFASAAPTQRKVLVVASDLSDNLERAGKDTRFDGVDVYLQVLGPEIDAGRGSERRARWIAFFQQAGARRVTVTRGTALPVDAR